MKILVMRPSPAGEELVNSLNNIGIPSWHFPLFDFYPSNTLSSLSNKVNELYTSNIILVFSKQSIYYTNLYLIQHNLQWPLHARYYAIGRSTALFLARFIKKKFFFL